MAIVAIGIAAVLIVTDFANRQGGSRSLVNASMEEIKEAALKYTRSRFKILSKQVTIPLARYVTDQELPFLGISKMDFIGEEPPMALVVLEGEFDVRALRRHVSRENKPWRVKYIAYIFDLKAGLPASVMVSSDGTGFRKLLNAPSLPEGDIFAEDSTILDPEAGAVSSDEKLPYGATLPPAPTPSGVPPPTEP